MLRAYFIIATPVKVLALFKKIRIYSGGKKKTQTTKQLSKDSINNIEGRREKGSISAKRQ